MNERIQTLAKQSGITLPDDLEFNGHVYQNALERFATSIARECISACNRIDAPPEVILDLQHEIEKIFRDKA